MPRSASRSREGEKLGTPSIFGEDDRIGAAFRPEVRDGGPLEAVVDDQGRLILPPEWAERLGAVPGARLRLEAQQGEAARLAPALTRLGKVYIEPTTRCNLACRTCVRNAWEDPLADMEWETFERVIDGLRASGAAPKVVFAGFGEPLSHPRIVDMVRAVKAVGGSPELVTNGTLLDESMGERLIDAGLDYLWASLDGTRPDSYEDVRLGSQLGRVIANLEGFGRERDRQQRTRPYLGIVFVAMKRNIRDLPDMLSLAMRLGAAQVMVSNVAPHTAEMCDEVLYGVTLADGRLLAQGQPRVNLSLMDANEATQEPLYQLLRQQPRLMLGGTVLTGERGRCPFIEAGATAVGWDGGVSPCPPLLHNHTTYLNGRARTVRRHSVGNVNERGLMPLWQHEDYLAFRERVSRFDFPPCISCGACYLAETNEDDCYGNGMPSCGGCPWAQGVIQCP